MIMPGSTLGVLGGGQLGRFFTLAAHALGYRVIVLDPDPRSPAGRIADLHFEATFDNKQVLSAMAADCAVITTEFENIPAETLRYLATKTKVHPSASAVRYAQNRIREKELILNSGFETAPYIVINDKYDVKSKAGDIQYPAILKTAELGYDGKGQVQIAEIKDVEKSYNIINLPCVLEEKIELYKELSVVLSRSEQGEISTFPVAENVHVNGILHTSTAPANISETVRLEALHIAETLAKTLDYVGIMAVELFVTLDERILVNEIAPRTHNSGHYTLDATVTSQFQQQVRAICGLPAGSTLLLSPVIMTNILGDLWGNSSPKWQNCLQEDNVNLYLYGKDIAKKGRKMGHFNLLEDASTLGSKAESILESMQADD